MGNISTPQRDGLLEPRLHARELPPEAGALARILGQTEVLRAASRYKKADRAAMLAQQYYKRLNLTVIVLRIAAFAFGFLLAAPEGWHDKVYRWAVVFQFLILTAILGLGFVVDKGKLFRRWMVFRAQAEYIRRGYFESILSAKERVLKGEAPLLPLKLDYFRRHHLVAQRAYYSRRGREHQQKAARTRWAMSWMKWLGILSLLPVLWVTLEALGWAKFIFAEMNSYFPALAALTFTSTEINRYFLALGTFTAVFLGALDTISKANLDARNAVRYAMVTGNLRLLEEKELPKAQQAAATGKHAPVREFVERVNREIFAEHREWRFLRGEFQRLAASEAAVPET